MVKQLILKIHHSLLGEREIFIANLVIITSTNSQTNQMFLSQRTVSSHHKPNIVKFIVRYKVLMSKLHQENNQGQS